MEADRRSGHEFKEEAVGAVVRRSGAITGLNLS
jgi:hypothetical protein